MSVIERLASSMGRNDEEPNIVLTRELVQARDDDAIKELVHFLSTGSTAVKNDSIKVLYEIGESEPKLIAPYVRVFISLLSSRNNRLVWGAMTALSAIAHLKADEIIHQLELVLHTIENGSIITVDRGITVLAMAGSTSEDCEKAVLPFVMGHLETCVSKQLPQHAERCEPLMNVRTKEGFKRVLEQRLADLTPAQQTRIRKMIRKLNNL